MNDGIETFLAALTPEGRSAGARRLLAIFAGASGFDARLWPGGIIGFGRYAYRYDSGHSGESLATGFAPRKSEHVVYIQSGLEDFTDILSVLGPHRRGRSCLYLGRLDRIDEDALRRLIRAGLDDLARRWRIEPD
jgi:hypothetical protein